MATTVSEIEKRLWSSADEFRANSNLKSSEYSVPVLGLVFLRYADHRFTQAERELAGKGSGRRTISKGRKHTEAEKLKGAVSKKLKRMVRLNKTRADLLEKFKKLIEEYNRGLDIDAFFAKLVAFAKELNEEDKRGVAEQLSDEELAIFDILTKPEIEMTAADKKAVKSVARHLLQTLKQAKLVLDWRKKLRARADVYSTVKTTLDELPRVFTPELYQQKCDLVYQHVYDSYAGEGKSVYGAAAGG